MMPTSMTLWLLTATTLVLAASLAAMTRALTRIHGTMEDHRRQIADLSLRLHAVERARETAARGGEPPARPPMILRVDPPESNPIPGPTLISVPNLAVAREAESRQDAEEAGTRLSERYGDLWELADTGASPRSIARATGVPVGRVELILGLRKKSPASSTTEDRDA